MARNTSWKAFEALICKIFGGKRRGADYRNREGEGGNNDCIQTPGWSIEIKYQKSLAWKSILQDALHARERAKPGEIPIAIARRIGGGRVMDSTLVCMTLRDFMEWFVPPTVEEKPLDQILLPLINEDETLHD